MSDTAQQPPSDDDPIESNYDWIMNEPKYEAAQPPVQEVVWSWNKRTQPPVQEE